MSAGHRHKGHDGPIDRKRAAELAEYFKDPKFKAALDRYDQGDMTHDIPYLGGSSQDGTTVYFDQKFWHGAKRPHTLTPYLHVHETVEGVLIRLYGLDYAQAHDLATIAERQALEAAGDKWQQYSDLLEPWIRLDEHEKITNPPDDILLLPYLGTPLFEKMRGDRMLSKKDANYQGRSSKTDRRCGNCAMFRVMDEKTADRCGLVDGPIWNRGWCQYWQK